MSLPAKTRDNELASPSSGGSIKLGASNPPKTFGRYVLHAPIARGGMARVYTARLVGAEGFNRLVAAKRLHPQFTDDPDFVTMFHDEARVASKIHHPNVVPVLDVVNENGELILVQEYVHGVPLDRLMRVHMGKQPIPQNVAVAIIAGILAGLHAAHETKDEMDRPLDIVHRDVSPQNVMVSVDGIPRLLDFGIARAQSNAHVTREGLFKGKVAYMAPEQLKAEGVTRQADIYAVGVLFWELLVNRRMHGGRSDAEIFAAVLHGSIPTVVDALNEQRAQISIERWSKLVDLTPVVTQAMAVEPTDRFATAAGMLDALLAACTAATPMEVAQWVKGTGSEFLDERQKVLASTEESWRSLSKMVAAKELASGHPESAIVKRAGGSSAPTLEIAGMGSSWPVPPSSVESSIAAVEARRAKLPWIIAAALLLFSGILVGILSTRAAPSAPEATSAARLNPTATVATAAALTTTAATAADTASAAAAASALASARASATTTAPPAPAPAPPPPHFSHWAPPSPPPKPAAKHDTPAAAAPAAAPPTPAPAADSKPKQDCDPPFYFEGSKKLYKPGCL